MPDLPDDLSTLTADQLHNLAADEIAELEHRSEPVEPIVSADRIAGQIWTRDTFARFWPCAPPSVSKIASRHRIERVGYDDATGQATYRAEDVVAARHEAPGQGGRTDIRDHSLATSTDPAYAWGRVLAAFDMANRYREQASRRNAPRTPAAEKIQEHGGYLPPGLRTQLLADYDKAMTFTNWGGARRAAVIAIVDELWPIVDDQLHGRRLSIDEQNMMFIGFHHQSSALNELPKKTASSTGTP